MDCDYLKSLAMEFVVELHEVGHGFDTVAAPISPEVEDDQFSAEVGEFDRWRIFPGFDAAKLDRWGTVELGDDCGAGLEIDLDVEVALAGRDAGIVMDHTLAAVSPEVIVSGREEEVEIGVLGCVDVGVRRGWRERTP